MSIRFSMVYNRYIEGVPTGNAGSKPAADVHVLDSQCIFLYRLGIMGAEWRAICQWRQCANDQPASSADAESMKKKSLTRNKVERKSMSSSRIGRLELGTALVRSVGDSNGTLSER